MPLVVSPKVVDERTQGLPFVVDGAVIAFHHGEFGHRPPGYRRRAGVQPVFLGAVGIGHRVRSVVLQRGEDHVAADTQVPLGQGAESARDRAESLEVRAGFPRRIGRGTERVYVRVHVRAGNVGLLVPGRRRQHHIGDQRRRGHPEVDRHHQVELALGDVALAHHIGGRYPAGRRLGLHIGIGTQQVAQEVFAALARRSDQVGPPDRKHPRPVDRVVGIGDGELEFAVAELFGHVVGGVATGVACLVGDIQAGPVELGIERAPAHRRRHRQQIHRVLAREPGAAQGAGQLVGPVCVVAPLVGVRIPVGGTRHLPRRTHPVRCHRHRLKPGERTHLFLTDVMGPATAVASHRAGQHQQREHRPVNGVTVEPLTDPAAHDDHGPATGFLRAAGEFLGDADGLCGRHAGDRLLPRWGVLLRRVVVAGGPFAGQSRPSHPVLGEHEVENGAHQVLTDAAHRDTARHRGALAVDGVEAGQVHQRGVTIAVGVVRVSHGERRHQAAEIEVPLPDAVLAVAEAQRAMGHRHRAGGLVQHRRLERRVLGVPGGLAQVRRREVLPRHQHVAALFQLDQERQVGIAAREVGEERNLLLHIAFREDDVAHRHRQRPVGAGRARHPLVGELGVVGVVGAHGHHLGAAVARLGHPVRVGGPGDRHVGTPHHQIRCVPPVPGFGHIGLIAEHLRRGHRQIGVPVVERRHGGADQLEEPRAGGVGDHGHRRDGRESCDPVGAVGLDGVHVGGGDQFGGLGPGDANQSALAAGLLVAPATLGIGLDVGPGEHGIVEPRLGLPVHLDQHTPGVGIAHPGGRIAVPGERSPAGAPARLVFRPVRAHRGIVGLLGLPGDDPVLDIDFPGAGTGAVDPMRGADHLVVAPPVAVEDVGLAAAPARNRAQVGRDLAGREEPPAALQQLLERSTNVWCDSQQVPLLLRGAARRSRAVASTPGALCRAVPDIARRFIRPAPESDCPPADGAGDGPISSAARSVNEESSCQHGFLHT